MNAEETSTSDIMDEMDADMNEDEGIEVLNLLRFIVLRSSVLALIFSFTA